MADMLKIFAQDLKATREEKNLSLKNISQQTRLNMAILENIENGDFTFQPQAYIRAFLKQYINSIGLDLEETLFDYDLARSGKYKPKRVHSNTNIDSPSIKTESPAVKNISVKETKEPDEIIVTPTTINEKNEKEDSIEISPSVTSNLNKESVERKTEVSQITKPKEDNYKYSGQARGKKKISFSFLNSPVMRNISLILFAAFVLLGIYSLVNILFFDGSKDKPEVIRQNFDDVVKEQEKKILGTRTPEEIQDSIRKAAELTALTKDSITLKVVGLSPGTFYLITDSLNYNKPDLIEFGKNSSGIFKAQKSFHISSGKTESFKATVNGNPIKFDKSSVSKVKITKNGIEN